MPALDGRWKVERTGGLLPPLYGVEKRIRGARGETRFGPVPFGFDVDGLRLRYRFPLNGLVDELERDGSAYRGRALLFGREVGRFRMVRLARSAPRVSAVAIGDGPGGVADDVDRHLAETGFGDVVDAG